VVTHVGRWFYPMSKFVEFLKLARPVNCAITLMSVWVGAVIADNIFISVRIVLATVSACLIAAYGNIINDIFDIEVDRLNKPNRPLVRGVVGKRGAMILVIAFCIIGLALSFGVGGAAPIVAFVSALLLLIYTPLLKGIPYLGNLTVAFVASLAFVYGGMAVGKPYGALILSVFAFLIHLGRELVKDIEDRLADSRVGHRTAATISNARYARLAAIAVIVILIVATFIPVAIGFYGAGYFLVILIGADFFLVESAHLVARTKNEAEMHRVAIWLKIAMPFGLLAVLLGHLGW
jgi:geranylgeranylglycerol-phosphate geranylgeranyltransferase